MQCHKFLAFLERNSDHIAMKYRSGFLFRFTFYANFCSVMWTILIAMHIAHCAHRRTQVIDVTFELRAFQSQTQSYKKHVHCTGTHIEVKQFAICNLLTFSTRRFKSHRIVSFAVSCLIYRTGECARKASERVRWHGKWMNERTNEPHRSRMQMLQQQLQSIENHYRHIIGIDISKIALAANSVTK